MTIAQSETNHVRIANMLQHAEKITSRLERESAEATTLDQLELLRAQIRNVAASVRLLSKQVVILADDNEALTIEWDKIVPTYIQRHL